MTANELVSLAAVALVGAVVFLLVAVRRAGGRRSSRRHGGGTGENGTSGASASAAPGEASRREFLHAASHDMRTPVSAILGYQELLADGAFGELSDRSREAVTRIGWAARQLVDLLDGFFAVVYADLGDLALSVRTTPLEPLLRDAVANALAAAPDYGATLDIEVPEGLPAMQTDPQHLERALSLALTAAVRASVANGSDGAVLRLRVTHATGDEVHLVISGTALGPGSLEGDVARRQLPDANAAAVQGNDVAAPAPAEPRRDRRVDARLFIAARLLRLLGGDLRLDPAESGTTTLSIELRPAFRRAVPPTR